VINSGSDILTVINGADYTTTTLSTASSNPAALVINLNTNKIYMAGIDTNYITVINGADNSHTAVLISYSNAATVNPNTNKIYLMHSPSATVNVIKESNISTSPLTNTINTFTPSDTVYTTTPNFSEQ